MIRPRGALAEVVLIADVCAFAAALFGGGTLGFAALFLGLELYCCGTAEGPGLYLTLVGTPILAAGSVTSAWFGRLANPWRRRR